MTEDLSEAILGIVASCKCKWHLVLRLVSPVTDCDDCDSSMVVRVTALTSLHLAQYWFRNGLNNRQLFCQVK